MAAKPLDITDPTIASAWKDMSEQKSANNWLLTACTKEGVVTLAGSGQGGFHELVKAFDQSKVMFGVLKVLGKDVRKSVESIRPKFIFFTYIGEGVPVLQRARVSVQRPDIEKVFNGYSVRMDISGGNMATFSKDEIAKELLRCGGAHAPTHYVFGPNDELQVNAAPQ
jgi:hypothetical protein